MAVIVVALILILLLALAWRLILCFWVLPIRAHQRLRRNGFTGPPPCFPLGNDKHIENMRIMKKNEIDYRIISNDIHPLVFPHFASWQKTYGKVFVYWLGTEAFVHISDPEFLRQMNDGVMGKKWGKPNVFRNDRMPMFGKNGMLLLEGDHWFHHRSAINPVFSPTNIKFFGREMIECTTNMISHWSSLTGIDGIIDINVEKEIYRNTGLIIARIIFGRVSNEASQEIIDKLRALQDTLFDSARYLGVPFSHLLNIKQALKQKKLGAEIDCVLKQIILAQQKCEEDSSRRDMLGLLLKEKTLSVDEIVDECKTFFFAGYETAALAITWALLMLALDPQWQNQLRNEIKEVVGEGELDVSVLPHLKKMGWVMNEVLRLYSPGPNAQRQAKEDIKVGDKVIPRGTNIWINLTGMNHDESLWGKDVNEFTPERFKDDVYGGCKHKMGFSPFGFGGRMCVGRNLSVMEFKIVLSKILTTFSFSLAPHYTHSPSYLLTIRPAFGLPLIFTPLIHSRSSFKFG